MGRYGSQGGKDVSDIEMFGSDSVQQQFLEIPRSARLRERPKDLLQLVFAQSMVPLRVHVFL